MPPTQTLKHSLARVTLQHKKGLDLLSMEQGGICKTRGNECCFYADHSGILTRTLDELRKHIVIHLNPVLPMRPNLIGPMAYHTHLFPNWADGCLLIDLFFFLAHVFPKAETSIPRTDRTLHGPLIIL